MATARVERFLSFAELTEHDTLLDLGCGDGRVLRCAAPRQVGCRCVGVDVDSSLDMDRGRQRTPRGSQSVECAEERARPSIPPHRVERPSVADKARATGHPTRILRRLAHRGPWGTHDHRTHRGQRARGRPARADEPAQGASGTTVALIGHLRHASSCHRVLCAGH